jgi:IclR family KDG regulon transcriptional repressor
VTRSTGPVSPADTADKAAVKATSSYAIRSLMVGLDVLEAVVKSGRERGISELAKELGTTKFQIFRHLHTLCDAGFLVQNKETERFGVGRRAYDLVQALPERQGLVRGAREDMARLRDEHGHTVTLARPVDGLRVMIVEVESSRQAVQYRLKVGVTFHLHASAHGKVALAFGPADLLEQTLEADLEGPTEFTITDAKRLRREIKRIREQGWASASQESVRGMNTVAAPIISRNGFEGSIGLFAPAESLPSKPKAAEIDALLATARAISAKL